jgi:hypothetical protein
VCDFPKLSETRTLSAVAAGGRQLGDDEGFFREIDGPERDAA